MIKLELLTEQNMDAVRAIHREDIPESWVDNVDTLWELTQYGLDHNCIGHTYAIKFTDVYIGVILLGEAIPWETDPQEMDGVPFYRLMGFIIDNRFRNKGIGSQVLELAIKTIYDEYGIRPIALGVHKDNIAAARFYEKHGFLRTDVMEGNDYYYLRYPTVISSIPEISAIYFALLQCGYDFFSIKRSCEHINQIQGFAVAESGPAFFSGVRQNTCEVYPYWPRAAILETASLHLLPECSQFRDYDTFREGIMAADNIADNERGQKLWDWIANFPSALSEVLASEAFHRYLEWENRWIAAQNIRYEAELQLIRSCLNVCVSQYGSPVRNIQIIINPIKCVYSADYHLDGDWFIFCSGAFSADSVVHEFLHHVVHPVVLKIADFVLATKRTYPDIDESYYLSGDKAGQLNAFEEYSVRMLTKDVINGDYPDSLVSYLKGL